MAFGTDDLEDDYDVIVLGAGAGGMAAAVVAAREGLKVLLLEKTDKIGGTTAISGGMVWAPNNNLMAAAGHQDSEENARTYLDAVVGNLGGGDLRQAYIEKAGEAVDYFRRHTAVKLVPLAFYPDYYPDLPGATLGGRVMEPERFDARALGSAFKLLRAPLPEFTLFGGMMVARPDIPHFRKIFRSLSSTLRVVRLTLSYLWQRLSLHRGAELVLGNALAGRLLKSLMDLGVAVQLDTQVKNLVRGEDDRITGVELKHDGRSRRVSAKRGVILATGGFSRSQEMRQRYLPPLAGATSPSAPGNTGDGLTLGLEVGALVPTDNDSNAYWGPASRFRRADGTPAVYPHTVTDRGKPGMMAVNRDGCRFTNESDSYHMFVQAMLRDSEGQESAYCHLLCDSHSLWKYGLGAIKPMTTRLAPFIEQGYLVKAASLAELAQQLGVPAEALEQTVQRYNEDARSGVDTLFGRGGNVYHKYVGDPENLPNPCMRVLDRPPYYAITLHPGDLGTAGGLRTDPNAQVLDSAGAPIKGLYACGNDMNSVMAGCYPGPGITLGPALVFGYLAALHIAAGD